TPRSTPQAKAVVRKLLNDASMAVRLRAAEALLNAGETTGYSVVASAARDARDQNVRLSGLAGLARFIATPQRAPTLRVLASPAFSGRCRPSLARWPRSRPAPWFARRPRRRRSAPPAW